MNEGTDLDRHAGSLADALGVIEMSAWGEASRSGHLALVELIAAVCATQLGLPPLLDPAVGAPTRGRVGDAGRWRALPSLTPGDRAAVAFAEQFSVDVSAVTDVQRSAFFEEWGTEAATMAAVVFVMDFLPRSRSALDVLGRLLDADLGPTGPPPAAVPIWEALDGLIRTVPRLDALDPVTTELVRLRGARQHQCRLCQSLRSRPAVLAGADEPFLSGLDDFENGGLTPHQKAVLGMTDAIIWTPSQLDGPARRMVTHASPEQCVEVVADVTRNALNKVAVGLGADARPRRGRHRALRRRPQR